MMVKLDGFDLNKMEKQYQHILDEEWELDIEMALHGVELNDIEIMHIFQLCKNALQL